MKDFITQEAAVNVEMLASLAHGIWLARNIFCFEGKTTDSSLLISRSMSILSSYQKANTHGTKVLNPPPQPQETVTRWVPPRRVSIN